VAMDSNTNPANFVLQIEDGLWKLSICHDGPKPNIAELGTNAKATQDAGLIWIGTQWTILRRWFPEGPSAR
jgi:hypothetical protein